LSNRYRWFLSNRFAPLAKGPANARLLVMVPRDGIEPPKNLDINGLDTIFSRDITSIPDKIPDKNHEILSRNSGRGGENRCHCHSSSPPDTSEADLKKVGL